MSQNIQQRLNILGWFVFVNSLIATLISSTYFAYLPEFPSGSLAWTYLLSSLTGHMGSLAFLTWLILLPLVLCVRGRGLTLLLSLVATLSLGLLVVDIQMFAQYRFHINVLAVKMILSGGMVSFSIWAWLAVGVGAILLLGFQWGLLQVLSQSHFSLSKHWRARYLTLGFVCLLSANLIHCWAAAHAYQSVTSLSRFLPLYAPATATGFLRNHGWVDEKALAMRKKMKLTATTNLAYPRNPLVKSDVAEPLDIVVIVIDAWRQDSFTPDVTPELWSLAESSRVLPNHYSSGNATRTGIFGLFYGIPGTYWDAFLNTNRSPLLLDRLQELNYEMGIYASAHLLRPQFNLTVFSQIDNLRVRSPGKTAVERDQDVTREWLDWDRHRDHTKPGFSFLFYDAAHDYSFPENYPHHFQPMLNDVNHLEFDMEYDPLPLKNRYWNALHFIDDQIGQVIVHLKAQGRLDNTLIMITGDHGEEMNDNRLNYWGHSSNYTDSQIKVPMLLRGPGIEQLKQENLTLTSHLDWVPSMMNHYLGIENTPRDFSTGINWFEQQQRERNWLLCASYSTYALLTRDNIVEVNMTGNYQVLDKRNRIRPEQDVDFSELQSALQDMSRFYQ